MQNQRTKVHPRVSEREAERTCAGTGVKEVLLLKRRLDKIYPAENNSPAGGLVDVMGDLERLVFTLHKYRYNWAPVEIPEEDVELLRNAFEYYETTLEKKKAIELLNRSELGPRSLAEDRLIERTLSYAAAEGRMAKITGNDRILIIGSGPFPETAICYAKEFGCKVVCVDMNQEFVDVSRKLVEKLGLSDRIEVVQGFGQEMDYSGFTKVLVTILTKSKGSILERLKESKAEIIVRTSYGASELVYRPFEKENLLPFVEKDRLVRWGMNFTSSLILAPLPKPSGLVRL